jgi:hypothetical protein
MKLGAGPKRLTRWSLPLNITLSFLKTNVSEAQVERGSVSSFRILRRDKTGLFHGPCEHPALKIRLDLEIRGGGVYISGRAKTENGNSGKEEFSGLLGII